MKYRLVTSLVTLIMTNVVCAATAIDLKNKPAAFLQNYFTGEPKKSVELQPVRTDIDFNQMAHVRFQQIYNTIPIWRGTVILHTSKTNNRITLTNLNNKTTMNGILYKGLEQDLVSGSVTLLGDKQKQKALQLAKATFIQNTSYSDAIYKAESVKSVIYIDKNNKAHYAFLTSFFVTDGKRIPHQPTMIIDASTFRIYNQWDQVRTVNQEYGEYISAGGIGGNVKIGRMIYDGNTGNLPNLTVRRTWIEFNDGKMPVCDLQNADVVVKDDNWGGKIPSNFCYAKANTNLPWISTDDNATRWKADEANGGYSPSLDALYSATVVKNLFKDWYNIPVLTEKDGKTPLRLIMRAHYGRNVGEAYWDGLENQVVFGDGDEIFYPLPSLDVTAHELGHGFTTQHGDFGGSRQMEALHESFSDMVATATQFYITGKNTWTIGAEVFKKPGEAFRYMDDPKKDGNSIDHMKNYDEKMNTHYVAGVTNKVFYLLAITPGWNTRMAFNVMVKANMNYWIDSMDTFADAACGVISAANDYRYKISDVKTAFTAVGIDTKECLLPINKSTEV